jgi:hypothetical protein
VAVVDLTRILSDDEEVGRLMEDLELGVSEAQGLVCQKYMLSTSKIVMRAWSCHTQI